MSSRRRMSIILLDCCSRDNWHIKKKTKHVFNIAPMYGIPEGTSMLFTIYFELFLRFTIYHFNFFKNFYPLQFTFTIYHLGFIIKHIKSTLIFTFYHLQFNITIYRLEFTIYHLLFILIFCVPFTTFNFTIYHFHSIFYCYFILSAAEIINTRKTNLKNINSTQYQIWPLKYEWKFETQISMESLNRHANGWLPIAKC